MAKIDFIWADRADRADGKPGKELHAIMHGSDPLAKASRLATPEEVSAYPQYLEKLRADRVAALEGELAALAPPEPAPVVESPAEEAARERAENEKRQAEEAARERAENEKRQAEEAARAQAESNQAGDSQSVGG